MIEEINLNKDQSKRITSSPSWPLEEKALIFSKSFSPKRNLMTAVVLLVIVGLGVFSGRLLARGPAFNQKPLLLEVSEGQQPQKGEEFGVQDKNVFSDNAVGEVAEGGVNGEGTHHLIREGGPFQTVFLFSSVLDLNSFVGRRVEVWGETFSAEKAGWLMDVGKLKVLD